MPKPLAPATRRRLAAALAAAVLLPWLGLYLAYSMFSPSKTEWALMVTVVAVITEVAMWIAISWLGFSALRRLSFLSGLFGKSGKAAG